MSSPSTRVITIPNIVSFVRLLGVPYFLWVLLVDDNIALAGWLIFLIGWTDWVDGFLARRLNQVSELGKALDPIADRLMIAAALVGGLITGIVPPLLGYGLMLREVIMGTVTLFLARRGAERLEVRWLGKAATFILYGAIPAFYLASAGVLHDLMLALAWVTGTVGLILYWVVAINYLSDARRNLAVVESRSGREED